MLCGNAKFRIQSEISAGISRLIARVRMILLAIVAAHFLKAFFPRTWFGSFRNAFPGYSQARWHRIGVLWKRELQAFVCTTFFFLRLPFDHHGPFSRMFQATYMTLNCTGPFNWGEAHSAGETVKPNVEDQCILKSHNKSTNNKKHKGAAHHGNQEPPGQAPSCTGTRKTTTKPETSTKRANKARLNVHCCLVKNALTR